MFDFRKLKYETVRKKKPNDLIFTKKSILETDNVLAKLLRKIFFKKNITYLNFQKAHMDYSEALGVDKLNIISDRNNTISGISNRNVTYNIFKTVLEKLGYRIVGINVELFNVRTSKIESFEITTNRKDKDESEKRSLQKNQKD